MAVKQGEKDSSKNESCARRAREREFGSFENCDTIVTVRECDRPQADKKYNLACRKWKYLMHTCRIRIA